MMNDFAIAVYSPILAAGDPVSHVVSHKLFGPLTNHVLMGTVAAVLCALLVMRLASKLARPKHSVEDYIVTGVLWQLLETICEFVRSYIAKPNLGSLTDKYVPYLWTVFFFIFFCNVLGLVPFGPLAGTIAYFAGAEDVAYWSHFGGTATGSIALTIPLAIVAFVVINLVGVKEAGVEYFKHFNPGPLMMAPMLVPLEVMGLFIKSAVLAMRLFGTMMAGHLVIAAFIGLVALGTNAASGLAIGVSVTLMGAALMALELFVAMLQAFIFTFLTTLFIAQGAVHHHDDHSHDDGHSHDHERAHGDGAGGSVPAAA